jgi:broad specificity phosphatase PhoE
MIVHFVRHARAEGVDGRCIGHTDVPLSAAGRDDARATGIRWDLAAGGVLRCLSSDLIRAKETAALLLPSSGHTHDARLREMDFGTWDGRTWADLETTDATRLQRWMADWTTERAPDGESFADVIARVRSLIDALPRHTDDNTLIVAHAGSIRAAAVVLLDLPPQRAFSLAVDHLHLTSFSLSATSATLTRWNASAF